MIVVGPTGRRVRLPCLPGHTYPDHAIAVPRTSLDMVCERLLSPPAPHRSSVKPSTWYGDPPGSKACPGQRHAASRRHDHRGRRRHEPRRRATGLVDPNLVMWGFAIRTYLDQPVEIPAIVLWEPTRWRALRGYGWLFPGPDGRANVGLGSAPWPTRERVTGGPPATPVPRPPAPARSAAVPPSPSARSAAGSRWA